MHFPRKSEHLEVACRDRERPTHGGGSFSVGSMGASLLGMKEGPFGA
jgi:formiminotetrahydrofolate cyclodeaminase